MADLIQNLPSIVRVESENIPAILKDQVRWINWRAGPLKVNGKFDKIPCDPLKGHNINALAKINWLSYGEAIAAYDRGVGDGIGIVLSLEHTICVDGVEYYLVALDFDSCRAEMDGYRELWLQLGKPYLEVSPSRKGLRMFALSTDPVKGGNDRKGHELYSSGRFMSVTGRNGRGLVKDATIQIKMLQRKWFDKSSDLRRDIKKERETERQKPLKQVSYIQENDENRDLIANQLSFVSSDCDYEAWRNIVWSILSTGWPSAETIARDWSETEPRRFQEDAFAKVVKSFDASRGIRIGTLDHHAREAGYDGPRLSETIPFELKERRDGTGTRRFRRLLTAAEVKSLPVQSYRVRGVLPVRGLASIYGEPGCGKTFLALDLAMSLANGLREWFGRRVKPCRVVYVALEGRGGFQKRLKAWERHTGETASDDIRFMLDDLSLLELSGVQRLAEEIVDAVGRGGVVFVDTLNQSAPGADENNSKDMSQIITNAKALMDWIEGLVVLVHHAGKDRARGLRGHSSLLAALDTVIEVVAVNGGRTWTATKTKDDEAGTAGAFELVRQEVGVDEDGMPITSCAVLHTIHLRPAASKPIRGKRQEAAMNALRRLLAGDAVVPHAKAIVAVAQALDAPPGRRTAYAKEVIEKLMVGGTLRSTDDGGIMLPQRNRQSTEPNP